MTFNNTTIPNNLYPVANGTVSSNPFVWQFLPRDPTLQDVNYPIQKFWLNTTTDAIWFLKNFNTTNGVVTADWIFVTTGGLLLASISDTANTPVFPTPPGAPVPNNIQLVGGTGINVISTPASNLLTISANGSGIVEQFAVQTGTSPVGPLAGIVTFNGATVSAGTHPVRTDGTGPNTMALEVQISQAIASTDATKIGLAAFNSADFTVDANGFVSAVGGPGITEVTVDANTAPGTNPVLPNGSGNITVTGGQVAAGTTTNVIRTDSLAANTYTVQVQRSQAVASSTIGDNGVSHFSSNQFAVDANGFVTLAGGSGPPVLDFIMQTGTSPVVPSSGAVTFNGATVAAGTHPVRTDGTGANTMALEVQTSQAIASTNATNIGLSAFNSANFSVDANGFVSALAQAFNYTNVNHAASPYTVLTTDYYISVDCSAGAVTLNFPNSPTFKQEWIVKDRTGNASTNNISITTPGATVTFDGLTTYKITSNFGAVNLLANATPTYEVF